MRLFSPYRWQLIATTSIIVISSVVSLAQPFLLRSIIDDALPNKDTRLLVGAVVGMVAVAAAVGLLAVLQTWLATAMGQSVMHGLRTSVFDHLQAQSLDFFKRTRGGEIQSRLGNDIAGMQAVVTNTATSIASNLTTVIATATAMAVLNWQLSLLTALILPPAIWSTRRVALVRKELTGQRQRRLARLQSHVDESLSISGAQLTKTLGIRHRRLADFDDSSRKLIDLELRAQLAGKWRMATMQIVFAAIPAVVYLAAGFPQRTGTNVSIGTLIAFTTLQMTIFKPIMGLLNIGAQWVASMALLSRIFGYLDLPIGVPEPANPVRLDHHAVRGVVAFEDVSFTFADADTPVLDGISLTIPAGGSLGVAGETGSGKSTLAALLIRLVDPVSGRVTIDGVDLRDLASSDLTHVVGMVTQETYLIHDSIRENLRLAKEDATDEELWESLTSAQVADVIRALPDGLDTMVGSRGHRFSGGERQRLAIARTLLRDPRILILDEATSALDNDTERELQTALTRLTAGRTTLTIAHRLSTLADCDEVVVLEKGRVVERGSHDTLIAQGGRYAQLATGSNDIVLGTPGEAGGDQAAVFADRLLTGPGLTTPIYAPALGKPINEIGWPGAQSPHSALFVPSHYTPRHAPTPAAKAERHPSAPKGPVPAPRRPRTMPMAPDGAFIAPPA